MTSCVWHLSEIQNAVVSVCYRGRNNFNISGSQQDYLVGKSGSPQIYLVVRKLPTFNQNNMTNTKFEKYSQMIW